MSNNYAPCFNRINFVVIPSCKPDNDFVFGEHPLKSLYVMSFICLKILMRAHFFVIKCPNVRKSKVPQNQKKTIADVHSFY